MESFRRPADMALFQHCLKQHKKIEIGAPEVSLVQHLSEIISLDSA
jgi:hypothetical protein